VEARTQELAKSLEELRTTQDRLVQTQKLALLGQLTAGIAHEIKNPLNFVINFSGLSAELKCIVFLTFGNCWHSIGMSAKDPALGNKKRHQLAVQAAIKSTAFHQS
jgi:signal transduction histidine kinase